MTLVVLEGLNGVGKSAHAVGLSEAMGVPILRPFRHSNSDLHLGRGGDLQTHLRTHGIPANTFVDDIYMADFLAATGVSAVLDRSIGSAIAYGTLYEDIKTTRAATRLLALWQSLLEPYTRPFFYIHMEAEPEVRRARCSDRWHPSVDEDKHLNLWFRRVYVELRDAPQEPLTYILDTTAQATVQDGVARILEWIGYGQNA